MVISDICIRRPVFATVMSLLLVLIGLVAYQRLTVREYPHIDPPVVNVATTYTGASAEIIESQVTQVLEDSLAGIEGIDYIKSINRPERSQITIKFDLDRDPDGATSDVRDRVGRVRDRLPDEIDEPIIQKVEADASPIMYLAFSSSSHSALEITDFADRYVKDRLQTLSGVAEVRIFGERRYSMRLWLDPFRLAAYKLTPQDVEDALERQNVEVPAGRIESTNREFTVLSETDLRTEEEFNNLILRDEKGYLIRLQDVGYAQIDAEDERRVARFKGRPAVAIGVVKQATANPLDVVDGVRAAIPSIESGLPDGMRMEIAYDKTIYIRESIKNVYVTIGEAIALVVLIIFIFLRSWRATLIPLVTIPVSLIGAFALMNAFGFSINTLTLLAMVLAIGLVVDDAIVMLENVYRHVEEGMPRFQAALQGSKEIGFAIITMTITLAAVYAPVGFLTGTTGRLFNEFAWTLAGTVLVSGFVALTLTPMMCSKLLVHKTKHGRIYNVIEAVIQGNADMYKKSLGWALRVRPLVLLIGIGVAAFGGVLFLNLKSELAPVEDQGSIRGIFLAPEGSTIDYTQRYSEELERIFKVIPEIDRYFVISGFPTVSQGIAFIRLKPWNQREKKQQQVTKELGPKLFDVTGLLAFPMDPPPLGQNTREKPVQFVVQTTRSYKELEGLIEALMAEARNNPGFQNIDTDLKLNKPQLRVEVNRDKLADVGIPIATVGRTLETMLGGRQVTRFKREGEQYDVIVQVADVDRTNPDDQTKIYVRGKDGQMIQLANLVTVEETVAPKALNHFNQLRAGKITALLGPGYTLGEALEFLNEAAERILPSDVQIDFDGQSREFKDAAEGITLTFFLALAFIYLVLAAQFESFVSPFVIMLTVPLSMTGALLLLMMTGGTLNIYSQVGLVTLIGLITKHGILIVEFANQLRDKGVGLKEAVTEAAVVRFRPILMTTGAMVLGAVPLATAAGAGAESRQQIGWVIVGGLLVGTFFTLYIIPTVYSYVARKSNKNLEAPEPLIAE